MQRLSLSDGTRQATDPNASIPCKGAFSSPSVHFDAIVCAWFVLLPCLELEVEKIDNSIHPFLELGSLPIQPPTESANREVQPQSQPPHLDSELHCGHPRE